MEAIVFLLVAVAIFYRLFKSFGDQKYSDPLYATETVTNDPAEQEEINEDLPKHLMETITNIRKIEPSFSVESFIFGASKAVKNIYIAAYQNDLAKYKQYIEDDPWVTLNNITPQKNIQCEISEMQIAAAELSASIAYLTVKISFTLSGVNLREKEESWTFKRDLHKSDPNWILISIR